MTRRLIPLVCSAAVVSVGLLAMVSARAELVTNGGFDSGLTGWASGNALLADGAYAVPAGDPAAGLGSSYLSPGYIRQTLATTAGQTYDLNFTYWGYNPYAGGKTLDLSIDVTGTASLLQELRQTTNYITPADPTGYFQVSYSFIADAASAVLLFKHANTDTVLLIDDVSVTARGAQGVPEPGTWALVGAALLAAGASRRRG